jgi:hypothetical protein
MEKKEGKRRGRKKEEKSDVGEQGDEGSIASVVEPPQPAVVRIAVDSSHCSAVTWACWFQVLVTILTPALFSVECLLWLLPNTVVLFRC